MCQQQTILAEIDDYHYLAYCEHETIHLNWGNASFHLRPHDFGRIVRLLERGAQEAGFSPIEEGGRCALIRQQNGYRQLWLGDSILFLSPTGFLRLVDLARLAKLALEHTGLSQRLKSRPAQDLHATIDLKPGVLFSTN